MEMIQRFSGVLHQGYHGNIIYNFFLPSDLSSSLLFLLIRKNILPILTVISTGVGRSLPQFWNNIWNNRFLKICSAGKSTL